MWFVDNQTGRETAKRPRRTPDTYHVWSPDSRWLLSWRDGDTLRLWEPATGRLVARSAGSPVRVVPAFSPSSDQVYVNVIEDHACSSWMPRRLKPARTPIELRTPVFGLVPHPEDGSVFAFAHDGTVLRVGARDRGPGLSRATRYVPAYDPGGRDLAGRHPPAGAQPRAGDVQVRLVDTTTWKRFGTAALRDE